MNISLQERLNAGKVILEEIDSELGNMAGKVPEELLDYLQETVGRKNDFGNWLTTLEARQEVFSHMQGLENNADREGRVPYQGKKIPFQIVRFIDTQAYVGSIPDGVMIYHGEGDPVALLKWMGRVWAWSPEGCQESPRWIRGT